MVRVLIVDDSATMRRMMQLALDVAPDIEVALARSGEEALRMLFSDRPDVVTLDVIMPGMDGLDCLSQIMTLHPCPVIMVSSMTSEGATNTLNALSMGAVDFIQKPQGPLSPDLEPLRSTLIRKIRIAARAQIRRTSTARPYPPRIGTQAQTTAPLAWGKFTANAPPAFPLVLIGVSTGGPPALDTILTRLPARFPAAIVIAQHMPAAFTRSLAARLGRNCAVAVEEVGRSEVLRPGHVYIARGEADIVIEKAAEGLIARSVPIAPERKWHPSVDRLVDSAMRAVEPQRLIGILLTGMGDDGAEAMQRLAQSGGSTIAESAETAIVWGMPRALVENGGAQRVVPLHGMAETLTQLAGRM